MEFDINGKKIYLDEDKDYLDFNVYQQPPLVGINFAPLLNDIQSGDDSIDDDLKEFMQDLRWWIAQAPRKRHYRQMILNGHLVLSDEQFFAFDEGAEILDGLENTGRFADYFLCEIFGEYVGYAPYPDDVALFMVLPYTSPEKRN